MSQPSNLYINKFVKGLYNSSPASGYEDPTYLGFRLRFDFTPQSRNHETFLTDDPLFASPNADLDSAERYLRNIGYENRAQSIAEFGKRLQDLVTNYPWYIHSVEGLADFWKLPLGEKSGEAFNNFRTSGKKLTFSCIESIDLRITSLADLYRKAAFDEQWMRDLLPENLKWFTMEIDVAEMRSFHTVQSLLDSTDSETPTNSAGHEMTLTHLDNLISVMTFKFKKCIFNFDDSFPHQDAIVMQMDANAASSKFSIIPGSMQEKNQYSLLNYILTSKEYLMSIGTNKYDPEAKPSNDLDAAFNARSPQGYYNNNGLLGGALNKINQLGAEAIGRASDKANEVAGAPQNLLARGANLAGALATQGLLGNVYGIGNQSIQQALNPFLPQQLGGSKGVSSNPLSIGIGENALTPVKSKPAGDLGYAEP